VTLLAYLPALAGTSHVWRVRSPLIAVQLWPPLVVFQTPAVAKNSYIEPSVLSSFEKGQVVEKYFEKVEELVEHEKATLAEPEKALRDMLENGAEPA